MALRGLEEGSSTTQCRCCVIQHRIHVRAALPNRGHYHVAVGRGLLEGIPVRIRSGFAFVRPWRTLRETRPVADLGGLLVYRASDVQPTAGAPPWVVPVANWNDALREPQVLVPRNLAERRRRGD